MSEENKNNIEENENRDVTEPCEAAPNSTEVVADTESGNTEVVSDIAETVAEMPVTKAKKHVKVSLKTFILSSVALVLATFMLAYAICGSLYQKQISDLINNGFISGGQIGGDNSNGENNGNTGLGGFSRKDAIDLLLGEYFYGEIDKDMLTEESLRAYLAATGDIYAAYYTQEELDALNDEGAGRMYGVGVNIINSTVVLGGVEYAVLKIINVMKDSPAQEAGLKAGDLIAYVGIGETRESVAYLGYDEALTRLRGAEGTVAEFTVLRKNGEEYKEIEVKATRREVTTESVYHRVSSDPKVGIIQIVTFELNTPTQFEESVEALKEKGCEKFIIDVRYNPGGYLISVAAVLSFFLEEGDVYIRTEDKKGNITSQKVSVVSGYTGDYVHCNVSKSDIGKYKDLDMVVLCNEYTASAGELFTATFRDYGLGKIIGTNTFGKGKMQTTYSLAMFGLDGAVKFTTHMYYSAKSEGYDGVGIVPDVKVDLNKDAAELNIYEYAERDPKDNQLQEAIKEVNK